MFQFDLATIQPREGCLPCMNGKHSLALVDTELVRATIDIRNPKFRSAHLLEELHRRARGSARRLVTIPSYRRRKHICLLGDYCITSTLLIHTSKYSSNDPSLFLKARHARPDVYEEIKQYGDISNAGCVGEYLRQQATSLTSNKERKGQEPQLRSLGPSSHSHAARLKSAPDNRCLFSFPFDPSTGEMGHTGAPTTRLHLRIMVTTLPQAMRIQSKELSGSKNASEFACFLLTSIRRVDSF
ncbi:hypothetical protein BKA63DRAFT_301511 [Paraphoma chrysanthemicola]|nr:hypothetical protein BKA63DRAFT_301511 [Paraphoma chrysanthemicola]